MIDLQGEYILCNKNNYEDILFLINKNYLVRNFVHTIKYMRITMVDMVGILLMLNGDNNIELCTDITNSDINKIDATILLRDLKLDKIIELTNGNTI